MKKSRLFTTALVLSLCACAFWLGRKVGGRDIYGQIDDATKGGIIYNLKTAYYLREMRTEPLLTDSEKAFIGHVRYLQGFAAPDAQARYLLWKIKRYYADFHVTPTPELNALLRNIPDERPAYTGRIGETPETVETPAPR